MGKKQPKVREEPAPQKAPKWNDPPISGLPLAWRFSACDRDGPFSWSVLEGTDNLNAVLSRLAEFEKMSWDEIIAARSHPIQRDRIDKAARDRLADIGQDDVDELMSFHINGANRVWCIQDQNIMRVLWWDPEHQVYPTERDRADRAKRRRRQRR